MITNLIKTILPNLPLIHSILVEDEPHSSQQSSLDTTSYMSYSCRMIERITRYDRTITARLSHDQARRLVALAQRQRRPVSELLREAVDSLLTCDTSPATEAPR